MNVKMYLDSLQVEDNAPRKDDGVTIIPEEFCKIGEIINPYPTCYADVEEVKISKKGEVKFEEIREGKYRITGKIVGGYIETWYDSRRLYLAIDVGFLIRLMVKIPLKYIEIPTDTGRRRVILTLTPDDNPKTMRIAIGDYITFTSIIYAMFTDMWCSDLDVNFKGKVAKRKINDDHTMWIWVEPIPVEKKFKLGSLSEWRSSEVLKEGKVIGFEYPTRRT